MKWTLKGSLSSGQVHTDAVIVPVTKNKRRKAAFRVLGSTAQTVGRESVI